MKLIDLTCPNCGARLTIEEGMPKAFCSHCGHQLLIDDGQVHADSASFRSAGYEFERGRMQAQSEQRATGVRNAPAVEDKARERHKNSVHRWLLLVASTVIFFTGILPMTLPRWAAILLSAGAIVTAIADRRINLVVRLLVIPWMLLLLLVRAVVPF